MVNPTILELSPTSNGGHMVGELVPKFVHAITGDEMLLMYFSSVLGE